MSFSLKSLALCALLSMAPVSELRGAIPVGLAHDIPVSVLLPVCIVSNLLPAPFVMLFLRRVLAWMRRRGGRLQKAAMWLERRGEAKSSMVRRSELLGLFVLVAIPLPGTGAWTGALVAALLRLRLSRAIPAIAAGVSVAGVLVLLLCRGVIHIAGL